jgi:Cu/Ag efflux pump CusA
VIEHDAVSRYLDVQINTADGAAGDVAARIEEQLKTTPMPFESFARLIKTEQDALMTQREALAIAAVTAVVAFLLLQAAFDSWRLASLLFVTAPLALAGGLVALAISRDPITVGAWAALAALFAVTVRHGLVLFRRFERLQLEDGMTFGQELAQRGTAEQILPTLASTVVTALALLPFIVLGNIAGLEVVRPLAIVMLGGLLIVPVVTLVILPSLYMRLARPAVARESALNAN